MYIGTYQCAAISPAEVVLKHFIIQTNPLVIMTQTLVRRHEKEEIIVKKKVCTGQKTAATSLRHEYLRFTKFCSSWDRMLVR